MASTFEKILLGTILVLFLATNAFFIFGDENKFPFIEGSAVVDETTSDGPIDRYEAERIALGYVNGRVTEVEDKIDYYEVEIEKDGMETEFKINKEDGDVFAIEQEEMDDEDEEEISVEQLRTTYKGTLTQEQAKAIALDALGGGVAISVESEREGGRLLHEVLVRYNGDSLEVEVDAETGDILEIERD